MSVIEVVDPSTEEVFASVPDVGVAGAASAVDASAVDPDADLTADTDPGPGSDAAADPPDATADQRGG
mgnify:CR=1 FL=1